LSDPSIPRLDRDRESPRQVANTLRVNVMAGDEAMTMAITLEPITDEAPFHITCPHCNETIVSVTEHGTLSDGVVTHLIGDSDTLNVHQAIPPPLLDGVNDNFVLATGACRECEKA
jgi:hypothetical protein